MATALEDDEFEFQDDDEYVDDEEDNYSDEEVFDDEDFDDGAEPGGDPFVDYELPEGEVMGEEDFSEAPPPPPPGQRYKLSDLQIGARYPGTVVRTSALLDRVLTQLGGVVVALLQPLHVWF